MPVVSLLLPYYVEKDLEKRDFYLVVYDIPGIKLRTWFLPPIYLPI
jgi:hypothetical protein